MHRVEIKMSSKRGFLNRSAALAAGVGFAALISVALPPRPAMADNGKHHHRGHYDYDGRGYVVTPGYVYGGYYGPPPIYYAPPLVYYQPPQVYYQPPPVYYSPPSLSFGINIPLH
jgi:hypothetical protein